MHLKKDSLTSLILSTFIIIGINASADAQKNPKRLTMLQSIAVGSTVGGLEVIFPGQMLAYGMNCKIKEEPFILKHSYKGFTAHIFSQIPLVAVQKTIQVKTDGVIEHWQKSELSPAQRITSSFISGIGAAAINTPSNAMQLYLQDPANFGKTNYAAFKALGWRSMRGFTPNGLIKEGPFAVGYQVLLPKCQQLAKNVFDHDMTANAAGGAIAGVLTAIFTQPGAVLRNKMQGGWQNPTGKTMTQISQEIYAAKGLKGFWSGIFRRGTRVAVAVQLYAYYSKFLEDQILAKS